MDSSKMKEKLLKKELMGYCSKCNPSQVVENIRLKETLEKKEQRKWYSKLLGD